MDSRRIRRYSDRWRNIEGRYTADMIGGEIAIIAFVVVVSILALVIFVDGCKRKSNKGGIQIIMAIILQVLNISILTNFKIVAAGLFG